MQRATDNAAALVWQLYTLLSLDGTLLVNQCDEPLGPHAREHARMHASERACGRLVAAAELGADVLVARIRSLGYDAELVSPPEYP